MKFILIFFTLLTLFKINAQKVSVHLSCEQTSAQIDDRVRFTVKTNISGNIKIDFPKTFLRSYGSMSGMEQEVNYSTGEISTIYYLSQEGIFKENGTFTIYAYVETAKKVYKSNPIKISIGVQEKLSPSVEEEISQRIMKQPVFGIIKRSKEKVYEGEALLLEAKVYTSLHINMMSDYKEYIFDGDAQKKEIDQKNRLLLKKEVLKGQEFYSFSHDKRVFFPEKTGMIKVKPFEMKIEYENGSIFSDDISFVSNAAIIEVVPLPKNSPIEFTGIVGKLSLNSSVNNKNISLGEVFELTLSFEGEGNIHQLQVPKFSLPKGLHFYADPETKDNISFGKNGSSGSVKYTYFVKATQLGAVSLPEFKIAFFNPNKHKYEMAISKPIMLQIGNNGFKPSQDKDDQQNSIIHTTTSPEIKKSNNEEDFTFWWSIISPFLLVISGGLLFVQLKKKRNKKPEIPVEKNQKQTIKNLREQLEEIAITKNEPQKVIYKNYNDWILYLSSLVNGEKASSLQLLLANLNEIPLSVDLIKQIEQFYLENEEKQFALFDEFMDIEEIYQKGKNILIQLEREMEV
ncbi:MAG: BatD family protein [Flavobacteriia bacterium]|nr:BatD family protein [Flavobacteriia bacterium]